MNPGMHRFREQDISASTTIARGIPLTRRPMEPAVSRRRRTLDFVKESLRESIWHSSSQGTSRRHCRKVRRACRLHQKKTLGSCRGEIVAFNVVVCDAASITRPLNKGHRFHMFSPGSSIPMPFFFSSFPMAAEPHQSLRLRDLLSKKISYRQTSTCA